MITRTIYVQDLRPGTILVEKFHQTLGPVVDTMSGQREDFKNPKIIRIKAHFFWVASIVFLNLVCVLFFSCIYMVVCEPPLTIRTLTKSEVLEVVCTTETNHLHEVRWEGTG